MRRFRSRRGFGGKRGDSSVLGAVIALGMVLTVAVGYFAFMNQTEQGYLQAGLQNNQNVAQQSAERLSVTGVLVGPALGFLVNNTGESATINSYFITQSSTGKVVQYNAGNASSPNLPYLIGAGHATEFNTGIIYTQGQSFTIKVVTSRGSTFVGTYPPQQINLQALSSLIAAGMGSISMQFSQYNFYGYSNPNGPYVVDLSHPHPGSILPFSSTPIVLSLAVSNNDPALGTITLDPHSNVFLFNPCSSGCGGNVQFPVFYLVNVASNGTITSTNSNTFVPIQIPYGKTATLYFASANDLSLASFGTQNARGNKLPAGEFDAFMILSGTNTQSQRFYAYSQNLPFAASYLATDIAWYSETPTTCVGGNVENFTLLITNSQYSSDKISSVQVGTSTMTSISAKTTSGFNNPVIGSGTITWSGGSLAVGSSANFNWGGVTPSAFGQQLIFPVTITWSSGFVQQSAAGCYIT